MSIYTPGIQRDINKYIEQLSLGQFQTIICSIHGMYKRKINVHISFITIKHSTHSIYEGAFRRVTDCTVCEALKFLLPYNDHRKVWSPELRAVLP